jgi:hypothetical protein
LGASRHQDFRLAAAVGLIVGAYVAFAAGLYWMMQPSVATNYGVAGYRPPPKTVVRDANSPWVPPTPEVLPKQAIAEPEPELARAEVIQQPKKQTRRQDGRMAPRQARPVREQQNPGWGYARSGGSRPWF